VKKPNELELDCLKKIANDPPGTLSPCAEHIVRQLRSLGLIEQASRIKIPLEITRTIYRLTAKGHTVLRRCWPSSVKVVRSACWRGRTGVN